MSRSLIPPEPLLARTLCCAVAVASTSLALGADTERRSYNLPAGDAARTLILFAEASGRPILFVASEVRGERTNAVAGELPPAEALAKMLAGTALEAALDPATGGFVVSRRKRSAESDTAAEAERSPPPNPHRTPMKASPLMRPLLAFLAALVAPASDAQSPTDPVVQLNPFEVKAAPEGTYTVDEAHTGTIIAVPRDQIPFMTSVVTADMIRDAGINNAADISELIAGVSRSTNPIIADEGGQSSLRYRVRGFLSDPLYDGFQTGGRVLSADNVGRVEASKGPNAVLYGQAPAGGVVNFIPQAPKFTDHASVGLGVGTNGFAKVRFDAGGPLQLANLGGKAAFRLGGSLQKMEREQIFFESETATLFGGLTWRPVDRMTFELRSEFVSLDVVPSRTPAFVSTGTGPARVVDPYNRARQDRNFSYNGPHSLNKLDNHLTTVYGTVRLSDAVTVRVGAFVSGRDEDSLTLGGTFGLSGSATATGYYQRSLADHRTTALKADVLHQARFRAWSVDTLLGFESHWERSSGLTVRTPSNVVVAIPFSRRPQAGDYPPPPAASAFTVLNSDTRGRLEWTNARLTQFIKTRNERGTLMWGVARGDGDTSVNDIMRNARSQSAGEKTTYTVGGTWAAFESRDHGPLEKVVLFGNRSTSFNIQGGNAQNPSQFEGFATVAALRAYVQTVQPRAIAPQEGEGHELGVRLRGFEDRVGFSALYFDQTNRNISRNFFVRESNVAGVFSETVIATFQLAGGRERAKGTELSFDWRPSPAFTLSASAQFTQGRVEQNPEAPEEVGFGLVQSPEKMFSFWSRYDFASTSRLKGLSLGFGLSYNSPTRIRPEVGDRYRLSDAYTAARGLARYTFKTGRATHSVALNVENVFDREYTQEENFLSEPRLYRLNYRLDF